jgi:Domain of unknown function (DUF1707)./Predicted membrane protein (DUF2154).
MSNPLEPTDVGPAFGGDLGVAESDRQHVITLLNAAHSEGHLSAYDRDRRIETAQAAQTFDDLVPLTRDLVMAQPTPVVTYQAPSSAQNAEQIVAIFSGTKRSGQWEVRPNTSVLAMFGGVELDLTRAIFTSQVVEVNVFCLFGGVELIVPAGTTVENQVIAVFGGTDAGKVTAPVHGAPKVVLKGFVGFGGVDIKNPKVKRRG